MLFTLTKGFHGSEWVLELTASTSDRSPGSQWQTDLWTMHSIKSFFKHKSSSPPKVGGAGDGDDTPRPCTSSSGCSAQSDPDSSDSVSPPVTELRSMYSAFSDSDKSGFDRERVPQISASGESELEVTLPVSGCLTSGAKSKKRKAVTVPKKGSKPRKYPKALCYYTKDTVQSFFCQFK